MPTYNEHLDESLVNYQTVDPASSTVSEWVDAFNNNAQAGQQFIYYLKETLANSVLYDPTLTPTIGGVAISSLTNIATSFVNVSPDNLTLDNFYLYFRSLNQILLLDQKTFDLTDYADGKLHLFYITSDLGFRIDEYYSQADDEICLFRFSINAGLQFTQVYTTFTRFGTSIYDSEGEYFDVQGCVPKAVSNSSQRVTLSLGTIKRSGILFDSTSTPDLFQITESNPMPLRYITNMNEVDYVSATDNNIITNKLLNYTTHELTNLASNKFTAQRILFDVLSGTLIMQYGNTAFDSITDALSNVDNLGYPFPYDITYRPLFIPLGVLFVKQGATDLTDPEQAVFTSQVSQSIAEQKSAVYAEDTYARSQISGLANSVNSLDSAVSGLSTQLTNHVNNRTNPHGVTQAQVNLAYVDNYPYTTKTIEGQTQTGIKERIQNDLGSYWLRKNVNETTTGTLEASVIKSTNNYIVIGGKALYLGSKPSGADDGSWAIST